MELNDYFELISSGTETLADWFINQLYEVLTVWYYDWGAVWFYFGLSIFGFIILWFVDLLSGFRFRKFFVSSFLHKDEDNLFNHSYEKEAGSGFKQRFKLFGRKAYVINYDGKRFVSYKPWHKVAYDKIFRSNYKTKYKPGELKSYSGIQTDSYKALYDANYKAGTYDRSFHVLGNDLKVDGAHGLSELSSVFDETGNGPNDSGRAQSQDYADYLEQLRRSDRAAYDKETSVDPPDQSSDSGSNNIDVVADDI